jgi:hypothetical protein
VLTRLGLAALAVLFVADIVVLFTETAPLFRTFASRMARRIVPVFSIVAVVFLVVVFAAISAGLDRFSHITLGPIGYGDITPVSTVARLVVVADILSGVVLLLFAWAELAD